MRYTIFRMLAFALMAFSLAACGFQNVDTNETAVAINKLTGSREVLGNGTHWRPGTIYDFHTLTTNRLMQLPLTLDFKTRDGNNLRQRLEITYMLLSKKTLDIINDFSIDMAGIQEVFAMTGIRSRARDILGDCTTTQYYNTSFRYEKAEETRDALNAMLETFGIYVEKVNPQDYEFVDKEYADAVGERKGHEQQREAKIEEAKAKARFYSSERERIEGNNKEWIARADGEYDKAVKEADAKFAANQSKAEARIKEADNYYSFMAAKAKAMRGEGGLNQLKLAMAEKLQGVNKIFVPKDQGGSEVRFNTLDMNKLFEAKGMQALARDPNKK